jgi:hypothetical protein
VEFAPPLLSGQTPIPTSPEKIFGPNRFRPIRKTQTSRAFYEPITKYLGTANGIVNDGRARQQRRIDALQPRLPLRTPELTSPLKSG